MLDNGVVPIVPIRTRFKLKLPGKRELTIWRERLPLVTSAYAFTDIAPQTIPYIIMGLATPPSGSLIPFNDYITPSRGRNIETARLLWDFDDKLFTIPHEYLTSEDKRLEELDWLTASEHHNVGPGGLNLLE